MEDWKEVKDVDGSTQYFFNIRTGETTRDKPMVLGGKPQSVKAQSNEDQVASLLRTIDETREVASHVQVQSSKPLIP